MITQFKDYEGNPILEPTGKGFDAQRVYNPAVVIVDGIFYMLYRSEAGDKCTGRIGLAWSKDGICFTRHPKPVIYPEYDYEKDGCEDPRIVKFDDAYWLTYVGNSEGAAHICLASSKDLIDWKKHGSVLQPIKRWDCHQAKAGVIVPEKVNGKYVMYFTGEEKPWETSIGIAYSDDMLHWYEPKDEPVMLPRKDYFDSKGVETGTNPIITEEGIFMVYSGWAEDCVYKAAGVLFSRDDPERILERTDEPILEPKEDWGKRFGGANHVVAESLVKHANTWWLYYGAADRVTCVALACK